MGTALLTSYFSKKVHPNSPSDSHVVGRNPDGRVSNNEISYIEPWYKSVNKLDVNGFVFHDDLSDQFVKDYTTDQIKFIKVEPSIWSNLDYRWICYESFLAEKNFDYVFLTDCSDVTVVKDPATLCEEMSDYDYFLCEDSIMLGQFPYLDFHQHFNLDNSVWFMLNQNNLKLINMGVVGGNYENVMHFLKTFNTCRQKIGKPEFAEADMFVGQYVFRALLAKKKLLLGDPVCSEFKKYQNGRKDVYFIHK